jgi:hypothetical protein
VAAESPPPDSYERFLAVAARACVRTAFASILTGSTATLGASLQRSLSVVILVRSAASVSSTAQTRTYQANLAAAFDAVPPRMASRRRKESLAWLATALHVTHKEKVSFYFD